MSGYRYLLFSFTCFMLVAHCATAGGYVIARITDHLLQVETIIMTAEEFTNLRQAMNSERIQHGKAVNVVRKLWDEEVPDYKCPVRELKPRKIIRLHSTRTYEQANERYAFMTGLKVSSKSGGRNTIVSDSGQAHLKEYEAARKRYEKRNEEREKRHAALIARAYNMYVDVMNELLAERYGQLGVSLEHVPEPALPAKPARAKKTRPVKRIGGTTGYGRGSLERTDTIDHRIGN